jgi:hypothetical protein
MSEQTLTGVCTEIVQKPGSDWCEFHIDGGGKWPVKVATRLQPLIELGKAVGSNLATWTYNEMESEKINEKSGKPYVNRYLEGVEVGGVAPEKAPEASAGSTATQPHHSPLIAGDKDRAITRMSCLKSTVELYVGSLGANDVDNDVIVLKIMETAGRFERWVYRDIDETPF